MAIFAAALLLDVRAARRDVSAARQTLVAAAAHPGSLTTPDGREATRFSIESALTLLGSAEARVSGSTSLRIARWIPLLGAQRDGLVELVGDAALSTVAARDLFAAVEEVAQESRIRGARVPLAALERFEQATSTASFRLRTLTKPGTKLWGPLGDARQEFDELAGETASRLADGADALSAARTFVGGNRDRRYLIALQNNAEMRAQGMVLSYATAAFSAGAITFQAGGSVFDLTLDAPAPTPIPPGTQRVFGSINPTQLWQSVNGTADFPWSARAMTDMYAQASGSSVDGVVAVDVPGLAALLRVVGPVSIDSVAEPLTDANVARVLLHDFYQGVRTEAENEARRERLGDVTEAIIGRLSQGEFDPLVLGRQLGEAAAGGHLKLWSADPEEEDVFERTGLGGGPATELPERTFHVAVENRTATKLDYHLKTRVRQEVRLSESGDARVLTTVVLENQVPVGATPSYAIGPDTQMKQPGEYRAWLLLWAPAGAIQSNGVEESGLLLSEHVVFVNPGETKEFTFVETVIPQAVRDGELRLRLVPQPRLEPVPLEVTLEAEGWDVEGSTSWAGPWDRVRTLTWKVSR